MSVPLLFSPPCATRPIPGLFPLSSPPSILLPSVMITGSSHRGIELPCIGFWCRPTGTGEDLVEPFQCLLAQRETQGSHRAVQLLHCARADNRRCHGLLMQQPGQCHISWTLAELSTQRLIGFKLGARGLDVFFYICVCASANLRWLQGPGQKSARERTPRNQADAIGFASWNHF